MLLPPLWCFLKTQLLIMKVPYTMSLRAVGAQYLAPFAAHSADAAIPVSYGKVFAYEIGIAAPGLPGSQ
jgi:hypothetical protein